jgi:hypothetical protein
VTVEPGHGAGPWRPRKGQLRGRARLGMSRWESRSKQPTPDALPGPAHMPESVEPVSGCQLPAEVCVAEPLQVSRVCCHSQEIPISAGAWAVSATSRTS